MAVRIDVPGIGVVEAEGVASEETLQRIAAALERSSGGLAKDQKDQSKAIKDSTKAIKEHTTGWVAAGDNLTQSFKNLALTLTSVATKFFANYDTIAASPIKAGQALLNTAIDITADFAGGLAKAIPVFGDLAKGAVDATAALAKLANDAFAEQMQKNLDALREYAKVGVGFSGGLTQMQNVAQAAGLGIKDFAQGVTKAKSDLNLLGMAGGDAAAALAKNLGQLAKKGPGGLPSLRDEMFKMGYSYEQQIEVAASYMANMKAAGKLEKMTTEELAKGTRDYARDLKVIADFTGKDALKVQERARAATMRAVIQQRLDETQQERYRTGISLLEKLPHHSAEAQQALTQMVLSGTTNIEGFTMGPQRKMIEQMAKDINTGTGDIMANTASFMSQADAELRADLAQGQMGFAKSMGVGGPAGAFSDTADAIMNMGKVSADQTKESKDANEKMATTTEKLSTEMANLYDVSQKYKVQMEGFLNSHLDWYAGTLASAFEKATNSILRAMGLGGGSPTPQQITQQRAREESYKKSLSNTQQGLGQENLQRGPNESDEAYRNRMIDLAKRTGNDRFAGGGRIGAGKVGLVGENGPEFVGGPASVLSNASYEQLMVALDAMREKRGVRFGENDFEWTVNMGQDAGYISGGVKSRAELLNKRASGVGTLNPNEIMEEMRKRPEYADMQRAKNAMDDEMGMGKSDTSAKIDQTNSLLGELVSAMKQNVNQTARVAMNTN